MDWLRFGTLAMESLSSTILLFVITIYLITAKPKTAEGAFFTGYVGFLFILHLSYTLQYAVLAPESMAMVQLSNLIVFGLVCFIQFAYRHGVYTFRKESRIVFAVTGLGGVALWVSLLFQRDAARSYDFSTQVFTVSYSSKIGIFLLVCYIWATVVLFRKMVFFSKQQVLSEKKDISPLSAFRRPLGRFAVSARSFAFLGAAYAGLYGVHLLFQFDVISRSVFSFIFNTASLLTCLVLFIVYINNSTRPVSVMTKLVGIPLAVVMAAFGIASSVLMPLVHSTLGDRYRDDVSLAQIVLDSGGPGKVPSSIAFMLPEGNDLRKLAYLGEDIRPDWADTLSNKNTRRQNGLIPAKQGLAPSFVYLDLYDTGSYFFTYEIKSRNTVYFIGFRYNRYRYEVHRFATRLLLAVLSASLFIIVLFPVAYRRALLKPIEGLLKAVRQVSSGNYTVRLPVGVRDEIGQLAEGYNEMAVSLENAEGNFKALAENANDAILILSIDGHVLFANKRAIELSGYPGDQIRELEFSQLFSRAIAQSAELHTREAKMFQKSGAVTPVEISRADTVWQGAKASVVVIRDITERERAAEAIQFQQQQLMRSDKLASIGALVAGMAHEINNPNQAISMNFRFFRSGLPALFSLSESGETADESVRIAGVSYDQFKATASEAIEEIESSTRRIDHIVRELKRFVQGSVSTKYEPVDVNDVCRVVADLSRHLINKSTNNFTMELSSDLEAIWGDRIGLEQVVLNLLQNACHALTSREQGVTIRTSMGTDFVAVEVIDQGKGIKEEDIQNITETFFTTKAETGGTGLGLTVSSRIIKEHAGTLSFKSEPGRGTTARVELPRSR